MKNISYCAYDLLKELTFPHVYSDYAAQNPKDRICAQGNRFAFFSFILNQIHTMLNCNSKILCLFKEWNHLRNRHPELLTCFY